MCPGCHSRAFLKASLHTFAPSLSLFISGVIPLFPSALCCALHLSIHNWWYVFLLVSSMLLTALLAVSLLARSPRRTRFSPGRMDPIAPSSFCQMALCFQLPFASLLSLPAPHTCSDHPPTTLFSSFRSKSFYGGDGCVYHFTSPLLPSPCPEFPQLPVYVVGHCGRFSHPGLLL